MGTLGCGHQVDSAGERGRCSSGPPGLPASPSPIPPQRRDPDKPTALPDDPAPNPQGPGRPQGHGSGAIATAQETRCCRCENKHHRGAPTPPPAARGDRAAVSAPDARGGRPVPAASSAASSPGAGPSASLLPRPIPGRGTLCGTLGAGAGTRGPSVLTRSRGLSQRGWRRRRDGFISAGGVHLLTERAQCAAPLQYGNAVPAGGAGGGEERDAEGRGPRARAGATGTRERDAEREPATKARGRDAPVGSTGENRRRRRRVGSWGQGEGARERGGGDRPREGPTAGDRGQIKTPGSSTPRERGGGRTRQKDTSHDNGGPQGQGPQGQGQGCRGEEQVSPTRPRLPGQPERGERGASWGQA